MLAGQRCLNLLSRQPAGQYVTHFELDDSFVTQY
jgi:hypothetical protein